MAWVCLAGDAVDLIPFVTGVGEATRAVTLTLSATENTVDLVQTARKIYNTSNKNSALRRMTGSYEILYESGKSYVGKGGFYRATTSAKRYTKDGDIVKSITWTSAQNSTEAFINEFLSMVKFGGPNGGKYTNELSYNKIWSPGKKLIGG